MKKILIIGSSYSIRQVFSKKFKNDEIKLLNFRKAWIVRDMNEYDIIIVSGFHHNKLKDDLISLKRYIEDYKLFIENLENKCKQLYFISTFIPSKLSFSRIVYFYQNLNDEIIHREKIKVISFRKIIDEKNNKNFFLKILNAFGYKFTPQSEIIKNTNNFKLNKISRPKFIFLKIKRIMFFERVLRLLDIN